MRDADTAVSVGHRRSFPALRAIMALMLREMSTRFGRTPGGYIWALVEPIGGLVVLTAVFSIMMRGPQLGNSFVLFFASGLLPFLLYSNIASSVQNAINFSKPLLMFPAVSWIDAIIARLILNFLTSVLVMILVFFGILQIVTVTTVFEFGPMVEAVVFAVLVGAGIGIGNCFMVGMFPVWGRVWGIATRPIFLLAGVFFLYENLPPTMQTIVGFTPWIHITAMFRTGVYPTYQPDFISIPLLLAWSLIPMFFGLLLLRRHYQDILNR